MEPHGAHRIPRSRFPRKGAGTSGSLRAGLLVLLALACSVPGAGAEEPPAVGVLCESLASADATSRRSAASALEIRYPDGTAAVPLLVDVLADDDAGVRTAAEKTLIALGAGGLRACRSLLGAADDPVMEPFRRALTGAAGILGTPQPTHMGSLMVAGNEPAVRAAATLASGLVRGTPATAEPIFDVLLDLLADEDARVRAAAAAALSLRGLEAVAKRPGVAPAAEDLEALSQEGPGIRLAGVRLLAISGAVGSDVVTALGKAAGDESAFVRLSACEALGRLGVAARAVAPALERAATGGEEDRFAAAAALVQAGETSRVEKLLGNEDPKTRRAAAWGLSLLGTKGEAGATVLAGWLHQEILDGIDGIDLRRVTQALARIGPAAAGTELVLRDMLRTGSPKARIAAARALFTVSPPGEDAAEMLGKILERTKEWRPHPMDARAALDVLIESGRRAEPALPALTHLLRYRDSDADREPGRVIVQLLVRSHAFDQLRRMKLRVLEILRNLGPAAAPAKPRLTRMLESDDLRLRYRAGRALRSIEAQE